MKYDFSTVEKKWQEIWEKDVYKRQAGNLHGWKNANKASSEIMTALSKSCGMNMN